MSLSIVFGTPTIGSPSSESRAALESVPSPPIATSASSSCFSNVARTFSIPPPPCSRIGLAAEEPRIVPPRNRIPRTESRSSGLESSSMTPRQPFRNPTISWPWTSVPLRTSARIAALRPGQSPPPVSTPIRPIALLRYSSRPDIRAIVDVTHIHASEVESREDDAYAVCTKASCCRVRAGPDGLALLRGRGRHAGHGGGLPPAERERPPLRGAAGSGDGARNGDGDPLQAPRHGGPT